MFLPPRNDRSAQRRTDPRKLLQLLLIGKIQFDALILCGSSARRMNGNTRRRKKDGLKKQKEKKTC